MVRKRVTGFSGGVASVSGGIQWDYVSTDKDLARRIFLFLEDRRLLTSPTSREDYDETRVSADDIRKWLTLEIMNAAPGGELEASLRQIRTACKSFVDAAGKDSGGFYRNHEFFVLCLEALRTVVGRELVRLADGYGMDLPSPLRAIAPPA